MNTQCSIVCSAQRIVAINFLSAELKATSDQAKTPQEPGSDNIYAVYKAIHESI